MKKEIETVRDQFEDIVVGTPLLTTQEDSDRVVDKMLEEWNLNAEEMLVFMGHGTEHHSNFVYAALNYQFQVKGHENVIMGTVEGFPTIDDVMKTVKKVNPAKVILTPFMIVAGDHANHDMAGEDENSWKHLLEKAGYKVECVLKGLGEYEGVRKLFLEHLEAAVKNLDRKMFQ